MLPLLEVTMDALEIVGNSWSFQSQGSENVFEIIPPPGRVALHDCLEKHPAAGATLFQLGLLEGGLLSWLSPKEQASCLMLGPPPTKKLSNCSHKNESKKRAKNDHMLLHLLPQHVFALCAFLCQPCQHDDNAKASRAHPAGSLKSNNTEHSSSWRKATTTRHKACFCKGRQQKREAASFLTKSLTCAFLLDPALLLGGLLQTHSRS